MRFVNNFELSSILAQPHICSSNRLGAMASQRDEGTDDFVISETVNNGILAIAR